MEQIFSTGLKKIQTSVELSGRNKNFLRCRLKLRQKTWEDWDPIKELGSITTE